MSKTIAAWAHEQACKITSQPAAAEELGKMLKRKFNDNGSLKKILQDKTATTRLFTEDELRRLREALSYERVPASLQKHYVVRKEDCDFLLAILLKNDEMLRSCVAIISILSREDKLRNVMSVPPTATRRKRVYLFKRVRAERAAPTPYPNMEEPMETPM